MPKKVKVTLISLFSHSHPVLCRPLSVNVLAGDLRGFFRDSCDVSVLDLQQISVVKAIDKIRKIMPHIIGISIMRDSLDQLENLMRMLQPIIKFLECKPTIIFGNVTATFAAEDLICKYPDVFVVLGEGEHSLRSFVANALHDSTDFSTIPNIVYRCDSRIVYTNRITSNLEESFIPSFDSLEYIAQNDGHVWLEASRGCNGNCTFCTVKAFRLMGWQPFPLNKIQNEIETLRFKYGVKHLRFADEDFIGTGSNADYERTRQLARFIKDCLITFDISTRADSIYKTKNTIAENTNKIETFRILKQAGLTQVFLGIESGSETQLKRYGKRISIEENRRAIQLLNSIGIQVVLGFICIDNLMTIDELDENIRFLEEIGAVDHSSGTFVSDPLSCLRPLVGCSYIKLLQKKDILNAMDNSLITYQANYSDWRVAAIVDMIKKWRDGNQSPIYYLKNKASLFSMRNDHSPQRNFAEDYLHNLKRIDFSLLKHSVQQVRISHNLNSFRSLMKPVFNKLIKDKSLIVNKIIQQFRCDDDHEKRTSFMIASIEKGKGTLKPVSALDP